MAADGRNVWRAVYRHYMVLAVQRIGAAVATVAVIFGQLTMSMLIDNFGWLGNASIPFSMSRPSVPSSAWVLHCSSFTPAANQKPHRRKNLCNRQPLLK